LRNFQEDVMPDMLVKLYELQPLKLRLARCENEVLISVVDES